MTFQITVQPSGHQFSCEADETVLSAAIRAGVGLPYSCKSGACSSCKGKIVSGNVQHKPYQTRSLTEDEAAAGYSLLCCAVPQGDLVVQAREVAGSSDYPIKKMPSRVTTIEKVAPDVVVLTLQLPASERLNYRAGQYIEIMLRDNKRRSYSMASAPVEGGPVSLHIRHMPGGLFTDQVFGTMKERDILRFEGPMGTFFLREDSDKPVVLLASGTGFAPLKAIVEHMINEQSPRPITLYWGARRPHDLYMDALCRQWAADLPQFTYVPVVSDALPEDGWSGRTGFVHQAVIADLPDLSAYQVYACGAPIVVESANRDFVQLCQLPADEFYADAFTTEADLAK
ncbi:MULTISPECIES: CDP-6-deoxy-delta-3,4-glucoseen reductase [unclassified Janthinobacterium]|uniref:CDP-6-deoxy-delta-3,4-glucoseen reductase n=1 Tax=unclassified Janthinobacterium TaxID=2610881 RepID=UPI001E475039|nr:MULTISPECIES: CDP-6-deoxy-delta-3,4-glucoseen reductase [unclassified Janthinobacterium]MCC7641574.1 CDP-6-deoxy-delta-3,4-glucoseen reductase [Janthinobacterium sp. EB271-G4-3-1]MCC7690827.1 CDP-6-deoxy-delta-3,4-glucoseen reductase [Janthinobacterium sp. EB271-G4-3-2]